MTKPWEAGDEAGTVQELRDTVVCGSGTREDGVVGFAGVADEAQGFRVKLKPGEQGGEALAVEPGGAVAGVDAEQPADIAVGPEGLGVDGADVVGEQDAGERGGTPGVVAFNAERGDGLRNGVAALQTVEELSVGVRIGLRAGERNGAEQGPAERGCRALEDFEVAGAGDRGDGGRIGHSIFAEVLP